MGDPTDTPIVPFSDVLITTPSFGQQSSLPWDELERLGLSHQAMTGNHPLSSERLAAALAGSRAAVVGLDEVGPEVFTANPQLRVVAKHGVGVDNIDCEAARTAGVRVINAPGSNSDAVADLTIGLMLALARQLVQAHITMLAGRWDRFHGVELGGRTLGLLGFGRIGQAVARRASAFGMNIIAYDPYLQDEAFANQGVQRASLDECISNSDFLSLHLPGSAGDRPLLDAARLDAMRRGAFLINAARGGLVDEDHLAGLLDDGHLAGAALDAFATEPLQAGSPLALLPNVILTPHIGAFTDKANATMGAMVVADIARVLRGEEPVNGIA
ncbi:phosphoglycerate dehydrogenase [Arthrobacter sp. VKM Ac-2550]|uniref:phosphoglycerate dehydrogenase n=1 Tax=Crystallibacter permensis TaxID=1938888 RepID=UPI0022277813|nr:phosphoglycerate dehydrogenase [Arthrobacter sp. VKM Ac-2550]